jgi:hypothetical protein
MSTSPLRVAWQKWLHFWFAATDPSTLGFMRIVTGSLVLYVHLAYCFDLQAFFGKDGWYGLVYMNRERSDFPHVVAPFWSWDETPQRSAFVPEYPHRRKPVVEWINRLLSDAATPEKLNAQLEYLDFCQQTTRSVSLRNPALALNALDYLSSLSPDPKSRANQLIVLVDESKRKAMEDSQVPRLSIPPTPTLVQGLPEAERARLPLMVEQFYSTLPANPSERGYVLAHLYEMDLPARDATIRFFREQIKLPVEERTRKMDYLTYWNVEEKIAYRLGLPVFSIWYHVTDPTSMYIVHVSVLIVIFLFTIGFCTRITSALTWLAAISYIHRTQQILFGMDTMMNILLFYLMIGNSGAALSVDRLLNRYRAIRLALKKNGAIDAATLAYLQAPPASVSCGFAQRLLQIHFCFIYMAAGLSKLKGASWWNNNAYWDTLVNPEFTMIHFQWYEYLVRNAVSIRPVYGFMAASSVIFTFVAEIGLPFLVWTRLRPYIVMLGFLLHAGVAVFMGLWIFSLLMMTLLLCYLPGFAIRERLFGYAEADKKLKLRLNPENDSQCRSAALAKALDLEETIQLESVKGHSGPLQVFASNQTQPVSDTCQTLLSQVKGLRLLGYLALIPGLGKLIKSRLS